MALNEELNKILKEMWRIDEKFMNGGDVAVEEAEFYKNHLAIIKNYYQEQSLYWKEK
jgi:hypothetical protein